ncbi:MAG: type I DNA topoisomerase, partial [bacterium]
MAKSIVIVESPAKARTIGKILGKGYRVESCMGHVRDLPRKTFGVDLEDGFKPRYQVLPSRRKVVKALRKAVQDAEAVYLAPDPDREGEAIAWHLAQALKLPKSVIRRVTFNEITRRGVERGFGQPGEIDMNLVNAQQARRVLDRIVGYELSPLLWKKIAKGLSAGRVQSVALRLVVEREKEIQAFEPEEYWKIAAALVPLDAPDDQAEAQTFQAQLMRVDGEKAAIPDEDAAQALLERVEGQDFVVATVQTKRKATRPLPPFATSQLQQAASVRLGFRPRRTMRVAQQLYEGVEVGDEGSVGLITYMRTDSFRVADEALGECRELIAKQYGDEYLSEKPRRYRARRGAQE